MIILNTLFLKLLQLDTEIRFIMQINLKKPVQSNLKDSTLVFSLRFLRPGAILISDSTVK